MKTTTNQTVPLPLLEETYRELDQIEGRLRGVADLLKHRLDNDVNPCECQLYIEAPMLFLADTLTKLEECSLRFSDFLKDARRDKGGAR